MKRELLIAIGIVLVIVIANVVKNYFVLENSEKLNVDEENNYEVVVEDTAVKENDKINYHEPDKEREIFEKNFNESVAKRSDKIFVKDFENYKPESKEIKIDRNAAEKIAEIGFEEARMIGGKFDKESQIVRFEERVANNFFIMDVRCIAKMYDNVVRPCYVFSREDEMGNGCMVFIDCTTGLIIGGQCFGD